MDQAAHNWVLVKEFSLSYHNRDLQYTIVFTIVNNMASTHSRVRVRATTGLN